MFDVAEIGSTLAKEEYKARMPDVRAQLLEAQFHLKRSGVPVLIAIAGDDRIGSEEVIDLLNEWLDARYVDTQVFEEATDEERQRPRFWRYWMALPPKGRAAIFFGGLALGRLAYIEAIGPEEGVRVQPFGLEVWECRGERVVGFHVDGPIEVRRLADPPGIAMILAEAQWEAGQPYADLEAMAQFPDLTERGRKVLERMVGSSIDSKPNENAAKGRTCGEVVASILQRADTVLSPNALAAHPELSPVPDAVRDSTGWQKIHDHDRYADVCHIISEYDQTISSWLRDTFLDECRRFLKEHDITKSDHDNPVDLAPLEARLQALEPAFERRLSSNLRSLTKLQTMEPAIFRRLRST
jgi:hypothetical protein